jgi:hypothetical protein
MIYLISAKWMDNGRSLLLQPLKLAGFTGGMVMLLIMSTDFGRYFLRNDLILSSNETPQIIAVTLMTIFCLVLLITMLDKSRPLKFAQTALVGLVFLVAAMTWLGLRAHIESYLIVNVYIVALGVLLIINGLTDARFSYACVGTILISSIIVIRFFDTDLDFFIRGLAFIIVGTMFLLSNIFISKRIKKETNADD